MVSGFLSVLQRSVAKPTGCNPKEEQKSFKERNPKHPQSSNQTLKEPYDKKRTKKRRKPTTQSQPTNIEHSQIKTSVPVALASSSHACRRWDACGGLAVASLDSGLLWRKLRLFLGGGDLDPRKNIWFIQKLIIIHRFLNSCAPIPRCLVSLVSCTATLLFL